MEDLFHDLQNKDVVTLAQGLLGCQLLRHNEEGLHEFTIVETEAYRHINDKASHASKGKPTKRTSVMFGPSGRAYVYLCYGIHQMMNIVTNEAGKADAVLIRGLELRDSDGNIEMIIGPGRVGKKLKIDTGFSGHDLQDRPLQLIGEMFSSKRTILSGPRVGIDYAEEDALLPWRFWLD